MSAMKPLVTASAVLLILCSIATADVRAQDTEPSVLVFTKTAGFRHASIPAGVAMVEELGTEHGFSVDHTEDAGAFTDANLPQYSAVVFLSTTGDVLDPNQQAAFERYIEAGGGFVGVHAAADTEYDWPWYGTIVGAYFESHPSVQEATVVVNDRVHPSTEMLPLRWQREDEWYNYQNNPRGAVHVLLTLDEASYSGGSNGHDHPIAWCRPIDGGRSWYTGGGHTDASYAEPPFRDHVLGGILWAAGVVEGDCSATLDQSFEKEILDDQTNDPMELTVLPDGRVIYVERAGTIKIYDPDTEQTSTAGQLNVFHGLEDGLLGVTHDPDFDDNGWVYLFYSPAGLEPKQRLSRFTLVANELSTASEMILLEVPTQREQCCHSGGSLAFGPDGNLYASLGDNTNPFESEGFAPIDERPGREPWDAQRSSANTQDLRGKILRITPQPDGTYTIPEGNLFPDPAEGRPEIFAMGTRNPFRIAIDSETGWLYWGDVGPDAGLDDAERGPRGHDEFNQAREAGNFGWPYCLGDNRAYVDFDFATRTSGVAFDCAGGPTNESPNNTGAGELPPARPAWIWYPYGLSEDFPALENQHARTAMAGPVYHFEPTLSPDRKLPAYYDDTVFIYEWSRRWIKEVKLDEDGGVLKINPFLSSFSFLRPIEMEMGPKGAIYMLEWGSSFSGGNSDSRLVRISYTAGPRGPVAILTAEPTSGPIPLTVSFSGSASYNPDPEGELLFEWDFDGDGTIDDVGEEASFVYTEPGQYRARLIVSGYGYVSTDQITIVAGNSAPTVTFAKPPDGGIFAWNEAVEFEAGASDVEDGSTETGSIPCEDVSMSASLFIDGVESVLESTAGCMGFLTMPGSGSIEDGVDAHIRLTASYTDRGAENEEPLTGETSILLRPGRLEAEHYSTNAGVEFEDTADPTGGNVNAGWIDHEDWLSYDPISLDGVEAITFRVASAGAGGRIELRLNDTSGPLVGTARVFPTGGWQSWTNVTADISNPGGSHELFLLFLGNPGETGLFNVNYLTFEGPGVSVGAEAPPSRASDVSLTAPYPNPISDRGTFHYSLKDYVDVRIEVFDVLGRRVATLVDAPMPAGEHRVAFETHGLASGAYFARMTTAERTLTQRFVVSR